METRRPLVLQDLVEEARRRIIFLVICVIGLSYLMSLTSSSVWVNIPAAACVIVVFLLYVSLDCERCSRKLPPAHIVPQNKPILSDTQRCSWQSKVNSPIVEQAIEHFARHLISEWVTDLWYSRLTSDQQGPEELLNIVGSTIAECSRRFRDVNLVDFLARDLIDLMCSNLELFRWADAKICMPHSTFLNAEQRDKELRLVLASEKKLHPALYSPKSEHKVLQHLMDGLIVVIFKSEDIQCSFFRYLVRELLACAVMRPVLNLANPRFINEKFENFVMSKTNKDAEVGNEASLTISNGSSKLSCCHCSRSTDPNELGVELVQLKNSQQGRKGSSVAETGRVKVGDVSKDPLLLIDTRSSRSWSSVSLNSRIFKSGGNHCSNGGLGPAEIASLDPESLGNVQTEGGNPEKRESSIEQALGDSRTPTQDLADGSHQDMSEGEDSERSLAVREVKIEPACSSDGFSTSEEEEDTRLDCRGTRLWNGRKDKKSMVSSIRHPLESCSSRENGGEHLRGVDCAKRRRPRSSIGNGNLWQESEKRSFFSGDEQDILAVKRFSKADDFGSSACSSATEVCDHGSEVNLTKDSVTTRPLYALRCEVLGANIVKSGSRTFAVYSISVTDEHPNTWSIKRRFRHFEELHRHLKEFPEYSLHLPPKHFLSAGLDVPLVQERCKSLDKYLKKLMQSPTVSECIEIWDFLSVDSQTYIFPTPLSILETLSVVLDDQPSEKQRKRIFKSMDPVFDPFPNKMEYFTTQNNESALRAANNVVADGRDFEQAFEPMFPAEWVPPNMTARVLDLLDVIFQLQGGGWIRRKTFWVLKQILQLGMGDALDDWLVGKVQLLQKCSAIASGIHHIEQILWPDGIFITKRPSKKQCQQPEMVTPDMDLANSQPPTDASESGSIHELPQFVHELMIDKAPSAIVNLVGRKEYIRCVKDLHLFFQSSVFLKQLGFDLLELLLSSAFPEMDCTIKKLHEEHAEFGEFVP